MMTSYNELSTTYTTRTRKYSTPTRKRENPTPVSVERSSFTEILLVGCIGLYSCTLGSFGSGSLNSKRTPYAYILTNEARQRTTISAANTVSTVSTVSTAVNITDQIKYIQDVLKLNMSALAELLDVSRPSVYKFVKGEPPHSQDTLNRLVSLYNQAHLIGNLNLARIDLLIKRPMFNGNSLFTLLKSNSSIDRSKLEALQSVDQQEASIRAANAEKSKPYRSSQDAIDEFVVPIMNT